MQELLAELGFYGLGGAPESPRALIDEVRDAEELGLGALFISERFDLKEAVTLSGAAAAVSTNGRTSMAPIRADGIRAPMLFASSRSFASMTK